MQTLDRPTAPTPRFVELAPGRTLAGLAKRINRRLPVEKSLRPSVEGTLTTCMTDEARPIRAVKSR